MQLQRPPLPLLPHRRYLPLLVALVLTLAPTSVALNNGLAIRPQMGWNSWSAPPHPSHPPHSHRPLSTSINSPPHPLPLTASASALPRLCKDHFFCSINETLIRDTADTLVRSGLAAAGYRYVNLDDCWQVARDVNGTIIADPERFPSGIAALASYIHSLGLLFGLYSDCGQFTCQGRPGGMNYEKIDAATYAKWSIDYLKSTHDAHHSGTCALAAHSFSIALTSPSAVLRCCCRVRIYSAPPSLSARPLSRRNRLSFVPPTHLLRSVSACARSTTTATTTEWM